jgi:hypothetical protein
MCTQEIRSEQLPYRQPNNNQNQHLFFIIIIIIINMLNTHEEDPLLLERVAIELNELRMHDEKKQMMENRFHVHVVYSYSQYPVTQTVLIVVVPILIGQV